MYKINRLGKKSKDAIYSVINNLSCSWRHGDPPGVLVAVRHVAGEAGLRHVAHDAHTPRDADLVLTHLLHRAVAAHHHHHHYHYHHYHYHQYHL